MEYNREIVKYFIKRGVSVILLFRRNLLWRLISVLANAYDREAKLLNGTHKSHVHSKQEDLQVKSSPQAQTTSQIHSDPAKISLQSQYSQPSQASNAFGPAASGSLPDLGSHGGHSGVPTSPFRGGTPLYQPTRNLGSWCSSPVPPGANGTGLAMLMYWQGYYGLATGLPHVQQQPLHFQPPPGMPIPPAVQQYLRQSVVLSSLPTGLSTTSEFINSLQQTSASASRYSESSTGAPVSVVSTSSATAAGTLYG